MGNAAPGVRKAAILGVAKGNKNKYIFGSFIKEIDE
jgi:hypothetical protein